MATVTVTVLLDVVVDGGQLVRVAWCCSAQGVCSLRQNEIVLSATA